MSQELSEYFNAQKEHYRSQWTSPLGLLKDMSLSLRELRNMGIDTWIEISPEGSKDAQIYHDGRIAAIRGKIWVGEHSRTFEILTRDQMWTPGHILYLGSINEPLLETEVWQLPSLALNFANGTATMVDFQKEILRTAARAEVVQEQDAGGSFRSESTQRLRLEKAASTQPRL